MNWDLTKFKGKAVVFIGGGKGRSVEGIKLFLNKHASITSFSVIDKEDIALHDVANNFNLKETIFIKNEGIPKDEIAFAYTIPMQIFFELLKDKPILTIGITGSKGKSTTSALVAHILDKAGKEVFLAGNIGVSPFMFLDQATDKSIFVLELSSYQLSDMTISPHISACINLYNDHTDWHGSLVKYWEAKHNIMRYSRVNDVFVYNPSFSALNDWAKQAKCRTVAIDLEENIDLDNALLFGQHNKLNAIIARQIAREVGISDQLSNLAIKDFQPLKHRMELVKVVKGVYYVDDAIGMTPEATVASMRAIRAQYGPIGCLLLGGKDRSYDFSILINELVNQEIDNLVLFPDTVETIRALFPKNYSPNLFITKSMADAVRFAYKHTGQNQVVLLSTAAPSYSLWTDFEEKGNQFVAAVNSLNT